MRSDPHLRQLPIRPPLYLQLLYGYVRVLGHDHAVNCHLVFCHHAFVELSLVMDEVLLASSRPLQINTLIQFLGLDGSVLFRWVDESLTSGHLWRRDLGRQRRGTVSSIMLLILHGLHLGRGRALTMNNPILCKQKMMSCACSIYCLI